MNQIEHFAFLPTPLMTCIQRKTRILKGKIGLSQELTGLDLFLGLFIKSMTKKEFVSTDR